MGSPISYHYADVHGHGQLLQTQAGSLEFEHQSILQDLNACADFWGGTGSTGFQDFVAELNRNFQVIFQQLHEHGGKIGTAAGNTEFADKGVGNTWSV